MMRITTTILAVFVSFFSLFSFANNTGNPEGYWQLADQDGQPKTIIRIQQNAGVLSATLIQFIPNQMARCTACTGALTNRPYRGLPIISDLKNTADNTWTGGKILNPETGKYNKVSLVINQGGDRVQINSYGFISWFGNKDIWTRRP